MHQLLMDLFIVKTQDSGMEGSKMYSYLQKKGQIIPSAHNNTTYYLSKTKPHLDMLYISLDHVVFIFSTPMTEGLMQRSSREKDSRLYSYLLDLV